MTSYLKSDCSTNVPTMTLSGLAVPCQSSDNYPAQTRDELHHVSSSSSALASCKTGVSKPSVNQS
jgi:hypothetical protein